MTILLFIVVLVILIVAHELGHFLAAKVSRVRVDEFGLGFPPRMFGWQYGETFYSVNWVPFGGFVKIRGEDSEEETQLKEEDKKRNFAYQPLHRKLIILAGGVIGNILLAWILLTGSLQTGLLVPAELPSLEAYIKDTRTAVGFVEPNSPAERAGLKPGDRINGLLLNEGPENVERPEDIVKAIQASKGQSLTLHVTHLGSSEATSVSVTPVQGGDGVYKIGVALELVGEARLPFFAAIREGARMTIDFTKQTIVGFYLIISSLFTENSLAGQVSGPVGIFRLVGDATAFGPAYLLSFMALLSVNLAVLNILPIPALDGGRILFAIIEGVRGKALHPSLIQKVHGIAFALLLLLMAVITIHDVFKLF